MPGRLERKVFTHLVGHEARALNTHLSQTGFRRSQNIAYRPACDGCQLCVSIRVPVNSFDFSRGFRRNLKANADLSARVIQPRATNEHYSLFRDYVDTRHSDGGMADMTVLDFSAMVDESVVDTRLIEFRKGASSIHQGELKAVAMIDVLDDGLSMIYSFYDPQEAQRSLGTFMILDTILRVRKLGLKYLYLGYWVRGSNKMDYKARFLPQERLYPDGWHLHSA
jgi:leucyl-tRNA---protein transferase